MAKALDVLGDRWTLLILRELLGGPARFNDVVAGLPGVAKNLLSNRLRRLESDGLVRRVQSSSGVLYAVTERGAATRPTIEALGQWGAHADEVGPITHERSARATAVALHAIVNRMVDALPERSHTIELEVDGQPLELVLGPRPSVTARPSVDADARLRVSGKAIADFLGGRGLRASRFAHVSGDEAAGRLLVDLLTKLA